MRLIYGALICATLLAASMQAAAETIVSTGVARINVTLLVPPTKNSPISATVAVADRQRALHLAMVNAIERYFSDESPTMLSSWQRSRDKIAADIDRYVLSTQVLAEDVKPDFGQYVLSVRVEINGPELTSALRATGAQQSKPGSSREITFVFVSREQAFDKSFDDRIYKRVDVQSSARVSGTAVRRTSQGEEVGESRIDSTDRIATSGSERLSGQSRTESGGSVTRRADEVKWRVANSNEINTAVTGVFSAAGFTVVDADFVQGASGGQLSVNAIRRDYGDGDDLSPKTMVATVSGIRNAGLSLLALATLDVGLPDVDPNSGQRRVFVTVNAKVFDTSARFPRVVSAVGPVQFSGIGPTEMVARTNALRLAAQQSATGLTTELASAGIR